jgi:hypothetical protein
MPANIEEKVIEKLRVLPRRSTGRGLEVRRGLGGLETKAGNGAPGRSHRDLGQD